MEVPSKGYHRLYPGNEVRFNARLLCDACREVIKDEQGNVTEIRCTYDPESRGVERPKTRGR